MKIRKQSGGREKKKKKLKIIEKNLSFKRLLIPSSFDTFKFITADHDLVFLKNDDGDVHHHDFDLDLVDRFVHFLRDVHLYCYSTSWLFLCWDLWMMIESDVPSYGFCERIDSLHFSCHMLDLLEKISVMDHCRYCCCRDDCLSVCSDDLESSIYEMLMNSGDCLWSRFSIHFCVASHHCRCCSLF